MGFQSYYNCDTDLEARNTQEVKIRAGQKFSYQTESCVLARSSWDNWALQHHPARWKNDSLDKHIAAGMSTLGFCVYIMECWCY